MRISINAPIARLAVELEEHQIIELMRAALLLASEKEESAHAVMPEEKPCENTDYACEQQGNACHELAPAKEPAGKVSKSDDGYKGFLYVKCAACGETRGYCVKTPIRQHRCACGHCTKLGDMKPLYVKCKCGSSFKYMTNLTDSIVSIECVKCGAPVDLEYHDRNGEYQTIADR